MAFRVSLPFACRSRTATLTVWRRHQAEPGTASTGGLVGSPAMLLLPFILGFSTTLVIAILNRFVESVGTSSVLLVSGARRTLAVLAVQAKAAAEQGPIAPAVEPTPAWDGRPKRAKIYAKKRERGPIWAIQA